MDGDAVKHALLRQRTTREIFRFPTTAAQAAQLLLSAYEAEVKFRHRECVMDGETEDNISELSKFLTDGERPQFGVLMCGKCGNGKTTMTYALQNAICLLNSAGLFDTRKALAISDAKDIAKIARDDKQFAKLKDKELLAIEDMGREPHEVLDYGNILNPVADLIEYRYDMQLFTVVTTNLTPPEIAERYGERVADRFAEMFKKIIFKQKSYRRNQS